MSITVPSAAATTRFGSAGTVRSGSRKKATVHKNNKKKNSDNQTDSHAPATANSARIPKIQRASERVCSRIKSSIFKPQKSSVKPPKIDTEPLSPEPQYRGLWLGRASKV